MAGANEIYTILFMQNNFEYIQELLISSTCLCPLQSSVDKYQKKKFYIQKKTTHRFNHYWGDKRQMNDICKPVIEYPEKIYYINLEELYILH